MLTSGKVARAAGVNVETIRYYERRGLLPAPPRSDAGYRQYAPSAVKRVRFIKHAQSLGFTLREIGELLDLRLEPGSNCERVETEALGAIRRIDGRIAELRRMRSVLVPLARACRSRESTDDCPILQALEESA